MERKTYMYKITNILDNKVYIGQSIDPNKRWYKHKILAKTLKKHQYIHHAMAKYGIENFIFEVIASCITQDQKEIDEIEDQIIQQYNSRNLEFGYNIKPGGPSRTGFKQSEETKKKMSETWHLYHSQEDLDRVHKSNIGKKHSPEHGRKISEANKGKKFCLGHKQSQETIQKRVASTLAKYGGPRICCVSDCNKRCHFILEGKRYCSLHGQRLKNTGSLELSHRKTKKQNSDT